MNGHDWLARQLDKRGLDYRRLDNAFLSLADPGRAQRLADRFPTLPWPIIVVDDPAPAHRALDRLTRPGRDPHGRASRPFNPVAADDLALFAAVLRGEHMLQGFRNRHVRARLFGPSAATDRCRSAQVSRLVKRLHQRGLVAKIPRSRRWRVTQLGHAVLSAAVLLREDRFPAAFLKEAS